jgi:hypothetical protein
MQESAAMRTEAWSGVERSLNSRLQQAEAKAAAAQERERAVNERLTQTMSRMAVMEAQVCFPKSAFCVADNFNVLKCPCCLVIFKVFCCEDFSLQSHSLSLYK